MAVTQEIIDFSWKNTNCAPTADAFNRNDQKDRAYCDFTVLELVNVTDKSHPIPVDPLSTAFAPEDHNNFDPTKIEIAGNIINLDKIKKDVAYITSQDKEMVMGMLVSHIFY